MSNTKKWTTAKIALAVSAVLMAIWSVLGTSASLAWFQDTTPVVKNVFTFGEFDLEVFYKTPEGNYEEVMLETDIFGDEALYEPGYTRIAWLKVKNSGTVDMRYKLSVDVRSVVTSVSVLGNEIYLPDYLKYGLVFADDEETLTRLAARNSAGEDLADLALNAFSEWDTAVLEPGDERYVLMVIYMPEEVGNAANYRGTQPMVTLGITVYGEQAVK